MSKGKVVGASMDWRTQHLLRKLQQKHGFRTLSEALRFAVQQGLLSQGMR